MTRVPFVEGTDLDRALPMERAIDALDAAFRAELPEAPPRSHLAVGGGDLLLMPAWSAASVGVKLVTVAPANPERGRPLIHGVYVLFDKPALKPVALFDAAPLTALRTAAVSGVATRYLAHGDARHLVLFGAGTQAGSHLDAMACVRALETVTVVSRSPDPAERLVRRAETLGIRAMTGQAEAVAAADLVCTCTTSSQPVFDGSLLRAGVHVNAVGSYKPDARELDDSAITRGPVYVDVETALQETGDLVLPLKAGRIDPASITPLADVTSGRVTARDASDITIFKSVGAAFEDLVVAGAAFERL